MSDGGLAFCGMQDYHKLAIWKMVAHPGCQGQNGDRKIPS
jgi:hypothetical protein